MIEWDEVRYVLAVARETSVRAAAERLGVNHSTVLRRIGQLERRLGAQMFARLPSGYRLTDAGEQVLEFAEQMEAASNRLETRIFGRKHSVRGLLRVALPPTLATYLLVPHFGEFARLHPEIEIDILTGSEPVNQSVWCADAQPLSKNLQSRPGGGDHSSGGPLTVRGGRNGGPGARACLGAAHCPKPH